MRKYILAFLLFVSSYAWSDYDANMKGVVRHVAVYTDGDYIYLTLENQPSSHPSCNPVFFVIPDSIPYERRQMLLSRLLMAYASKENVNIGYDSQGGCTHGYITVHRVG
jgi:hypothetical protein